MYSENNSNSCDKDEEESGDAESLQERRLFVANLPARAPVAELATYFATFGRVLSCQAGSRGFGFVTFAKAEAATRALNLQGGHRLLGRLVLVDRFRVPSSCASAASPAASPDSGINGRRLFVRNLPPLVTLDRLRQFFASFGRVDSVYVMPHKRVGFVTFATAAEAMALLVDEPAAVTAAGQQQEFAQLDGHRLLLSWAYPKLLLASPSPSSLSKSSSSSRDNLTTACATTASTTTRTAVVGCLGASATAESVARLVSAMSLQRQQQQQPPPPLPVPLPPTVIRMTPHPAPLPAVHFAGSGCYYCWPNNAGTAAGSWYSF